MLDGVSADTFERHPGRFPHLTGLAARGARVDRLAAEVPGTSLPGRASILTGVGSAENGVYGNMLWDGDGFRYATPDDVRAPTIAARARAAGLTVASIGMGMVKPEDATLFAPPWWVGAFVQRARDTEPKPAAEGWRRVVERGIDVEVAQAAATLGLPSSFDALGSDPSEAAMAGFLGDQRVAQWVGAIALRDEAPDLILAELLMTDTVQHRAGHDTPLALWAMSTADAFVGDVLARLRAAGREDAFDVLVLSDHGHGPIDRALRPDVLLPGLRFQSEGGVLHVAPRDRDEADRAERVLSEHGCVEFPTDHLPEALRGELRAFLAPDGVSFEHDAPTPAEPVAAPQARSSHGARPGHPADDRVWIAAGPNVRPGRIAAAPATAVAGTIGALLGIGRDTIGIVTEGVNTEH
jgi:predicted AlkP superfamily pyrophosphatase or phosphodiesterase